MSNRGAKKRQRSAKHPPPQKGSKGLNNVRSSNYGTSRQLPDIERSPVLSSYLAPESNVLIVGDGDFSFGRALVQLRAQYRQESGHSQAKNMSHGTVRLGSLTVTGFDSRAEAVRKYGGSTHRNDNKGIEKYLQILENDPDVTVLHSIDATKLGEQLGPNSYQTSPSRQKQHQHRHHPTTTKWFGYYNIVVFNFPHSGEQRVHINRNLMYDFFQSVRGLFLAQDEQASQQLNPSDSRGRYQRKQQKSRQVHVTIKNQRPYTHWGIEDSAKEAGFWPAKIDKVRFDMAMWNTWGYRHQTTIGPREATSHPQLLSHEAEAKLAQTLIFEFVDQDDPVTNHDEIIEGTPQQQPERLTSRIDKPSTRMVENPGAGDSNHETKSAIQHTDQITNATKSVTQQQHADSVTKETKSFTQHTDKVTKEWVDDLVHQRDEARRNKNWVEADRIRQLLIVEYGVVLYDQNQHNNTSWSWHKNKKTTKATTDGVIG